MTATPGEGSSAFGVGRVEVDETTRYTFSRGSEDSPDKRLNH